MEGQDYCKMENEDKMNKKSNAELIQNKELLETYIQEKHHIFLVDSMMEKLATQMRNIGIDAEICDSSSSPKEKVKHAEETQRILLTRSKHLMMVKKSCVMIKLISTKPMGKYFNPIS